MAREIFKKAKEIRDLLREEFPHDRVKVRVKDNIINLTCSELDNDEIEEVIKMELGNLPEMTINEVKIED